MLKKLLIYLGCVLVATAGCTGIVVGNYAINKNQSVSTSIESSKTNKELELAIENIKKAEDLVADVNVNLKVSNIEVIVTGKLEAELKEKVKLNFSGNIKANKNDIPLNITYIENKIYINSNDINVYIKTDNLLKELNGILKSVGFDFLDLENLSMDTVLGLLGNCETIPQEEGNLLYLNLMDLLVVNLYLDKDNMLYNVNIPTINIEGISLSANINIEYNKNIKVTKPENYNKYKDVTNCIQYIQRIINMIGKKSIGGKIDLDYKDINIELDFIADFKDDVKVYISGEIFNKSLIINIEGDNCYINFDEIKIKTTITELKDMLNNLLIDIDFGSVTEDLLTNIKDLKITQLNFEEERLIIGINNKFNFEANLNNETFTNLKLDIDNLSLNIELSEDNQYIEPDKNEYISLSSYLGAIDMKGVGKILSAGLNYIKQDVMCVSLSLGNDSFNTMIELKIIKNNNKLDKLIVAGELLENELSLIYDFKTQYVYLTYGKINVKCTSKELATTISDVLKDFNIDISPVLSLFNLSDNVNINEVFNFVEKTEFKEIIFEILDKLVIDQFGNIRLNSEQLKLNGSIKNNRIRFVATTNLLNNAYLVLDLGVKEEDLIYGSNVEENLNPDKYVDLTEFSTIITGITNIIKNKNLSGNVSIKLSDKKLNLNYIIDLNNGFNCQLYGYIFNELMIVTIDEQSIYLSYGKLNIKANLKDLDEFLTKIVDTFNLDKDLTKLFEVSIKNTINQILNKINVKTLTPNMLQISIDNLNLYLVSEVNSTGLSVIYNSLRIDFSLNYFKTSLIEINKDSYQEIVGEFSNIDLSDYNSFLELISSYLNGKQFNCKLVTKIKDIDINLDINFALNNNKISKFVAIGNVKNNSISLVYVPSSNTQNSYFYLTINTLKLKFNLSSLGNITSVVADLLGLDINEINKLFNINLQKIENEIFKTLLSNYNISDLSINEILKEIYFKDGVLTVKILDLFKLGIVTNMKNGNFVIEKIVVSNFNILGTNLNAELKLNSSSIKEPTISGYYLDVSKLADFIEIGTNLLNKKQIKLQGNVDINIGKLSLINLNIYGQFELRDVYKNGKQSLDIVGVLLIDNLPLSCFIMDDINGLTYKNHRLLIKIENNKLSFSRTADKVIGITIFGQELYSYKGVTKTLKQGNYNITDLLSGKQDILQMLQDMVGYNEFVGEILDKVMENSKCPDDYSIDKIIDQNNGFICLNNYYEINLNGDYLFKNENFGKIKIGITKEGKNIKNISLNLNIANDLVSINSSNIAIGNITDYIKDNTGNYISVSDYISKLIQSM